MRWHLGVSLGDAKPLHKAPLLLGIPFSEVG
jgi:hypothetical protein